MRYIVMLLLLALVNSTETTPDQPVSNLHIKHSYQHFIDTDNKNELNRFLYKMSALESGHDPYIINTYGYIGKYQFGTAALIAVGHRDINARKFRKNPEVFSENVQDLAMLKLMYLNYRFLKPDIERFSGKTISGIQLSAANLLAASHLVGAHATQQWLYSYGRIEFKDGYGTSVSKYLKKFESNKFNPSILPKLINSTSTEYNHWILSQDREINRRL